MIRGLCAVLLICGFSAAAAVNAQAPPADVAAPHEIPNAIRDRLPEAVPPAVVPPVPAASGPTPAASAEPDEGASREAPAGTEPVFLSRPSEPKRFPLEASWENGLWFETTNKEFRIHVGGNAQVDSTWLIGPHGVFALPNGSQNGVENASAIFLRRVRLRADGSIYELFDYSVEYDLANANNENDGLQPPSFGNITGAPAPCNIWMQVRDVPYFGSIRFGNQVKPIGMSNNTSQAMLPFLERPDNMDAFWGPFDSGFALGVTARDWTESERVTWQYGIYRPAINVFGVALNKGAYGGRVTALPIYEDGGERLVHIGFGTFNGELVQNELRVRARPLLRNAPGYAVPVLVDTGNMAGSRQYTLNPEFAAVIGSWTFQAEWTGQYLTQATPVGGVPQGTVFFHGGYVEALYFLTGEHQEYEKREGAFGRVVPRNKYHIKRGDCGRSCGAWQVGARFSYLDLNDKGINGGQIYDWTLGLNWFLNPNMRVQFNYIAEHRDGPQDVASGWINGFGIRAGYDF